MNRPTHILAVLAIALGARSAPAQAPAAQAPQGGPMRLELVSASLLAETRAIAPGRPFWVAIEMRMLPGWHLNWVNPGDAGLAPSVQWTLPPGFEASELMWPYPARFELPELSIFGYEDRVLLLSRITPPPQIGRQPLTIRAHVDWLACRDACVPGQSDVAVALNVGEEAENAYAVWAEEIEQARAMLPVAAEQWRFHARIDGERLAISATAPEGETVDVKDVTFFPIASDVIENAAEQEFRRRPDGFTLEMARARMTTRKPERIRGVLVSQNGWGSVASKALAVDIPVDG